MRDTMTESAVVLVEGSKWPPLYAKMLDGRIVYSYAYAGPLWHDIEEELARPGECVSQDYPLIRAALGLPPE